MNTWVLRLDQIMSILLVFFIAHAKHNLIKLKLYNNKSVRAVNIISESGMRNSSKPNVLIFEN